MRLYDYKHAFECDVPQPNTGLYRFTSLEEALIFGINSLYNPNSSNNFLKTGIKLMPTPYDDFGIAHYYNGEEVENFQCELDFDSESIKITRYWCDFSIKDCPYLVPNDEPFFISFELLRK